MHSSLATIRRIRFRTIGDGIPWALVELDDGCGVLIMAWLVGGIAEFARELQRGDLVWISSQVGVRRTVEGREYTVVGVIEFAHVVAALKDRVPYPGPLPQKMLNG